MKKLTFLLTVSALGATMLAASAADRLAPRDDTTTTGTRPTPPTDKRGRDGTVIERPTTRPERPDTATRPTLPDDVKALVEKFEAARKEFLASQSELEKQLKGASEEERAKLREQLKTQRDAWLESTKTLREELRNKLPDRPQLPKPDDTKRGRTRE